MSREYITLKKPLSISSYDLSDCDNIESADNNYYINNLNSYGSFNSVKKQIIPKNESIIFQNCSSILNLKFNNNSEYIKIHNCGMYIIHFSCLLEKPSTIGLYINNHLKKSTITIENNLIIIHEILKLNYGDKLFFKNISTEPLITLSQVLNINVEIQTVQLTISKIAPLFNNSIEITDSDASL